MTRSKLQHADAEWLDLKRLSHYSSASEQTLRKWIHSHTNPLPASQRGNKIYVRRRDFDEWMERHALKPNVQIDRIVDDVLSSIAGQQARSKQV